MEKWRADEDKRLEAPAYIERDGKKYIKEGTVIGTTTNSDIVMYLINRENSIVEDVESYIRLAKKGIDTDFPEEFIFWLGVLLEGGCEGQYDLGEYYGVEVLADGAGNTTAFGYKTDALLGGEDYKDCKNADAVLQHHLNTIGGKYNTPMDPQQLVAQIVKNNKSVFNADGTVREDADWSKLDLPNKQWLIENSYLSENTNSAASNTISSISTQNMSPDPIIGGWSGII